MSSFLVMSVSQSWHMDLMRRDRKESKFVEQAFGNTGRQFDSMPLAVKEAIKVLVIFPMNT